MAAVAFPHGEIHANREPPRPLSLDPMIPVVRRILSDVDFIRPLKTAVDCIDSSALINVSLVSLKCAPYVFGGDNRLVQEFDNGISCRLRYLETAVMSLASIVYNVVFGTIFTVLSLVTLGQVKMIYDQMRKHWTHTALAAGATAISLIGTASPDLGIKANAAGMFALGIAVVQLMQGDVISRLSAAYHRHGQELKNATLQGLRGDQAFYNRHFVPFFNYLDQHLTNQIHTFSDFMDVAQGAQALFPPVAPSTTTEVITDNLQQLLANWSSSSNRSRSTASGITSA